MPILVKAAAQKPPQLTPTLPFRWLAARIMTSQVNFTLDGANLTTKHLTGAVGGDLIVKSRQDTYQYDSKQQNIGGSADIDFSGKLQNANINLANSS